MSEREMEKGVYDNAIIISCKETDENIRNLLSQSLERLLEFLSCNLSLIYFFLLVYLSLNFSRGYYLLFIYN